jgi:hypothetical protein
LPGNRQAADCNCSSPPRVPYRTSRFIKKSLYSVLPLRFHPQHSVQRDKAFHIGSKKGISLVVLLLVDG